MDLSGEDNKADPPRALENLNCKHHDYFIDLKESTMKQSNTLNLGI